MSSLDVNDILEELLDENKRLLNELLFAHKVVVKSLKFKVFIESIGKDFVDNLNPDSRRKYEELSRELNLLIHQKSVNISDESPNESKTVTVTKSVTSEQSIETDSDYHTINEDNVSDEEVYNSEEESVKLNVSKASKTKNNSPKYLCNRCGSSFKFSDSVEVHMWHCGLESQSIRTESQPEYNSSNIEEGEEEMISGELVTEKMVTLDKGNNDEGSDNEEHVAEEHLVEESVTDRPLVRTENLSNKPMTESTSKAVSGQQSSDGLNLSSIEDKKKLFSVKFGSILANALFDKRKTMIAYDKKLRQWKCDFPGCDYQRKHKSMVKLHLRRHSNDRPFGCDYCDNNYKLKKHLKEHMKTQHLDQCPNDPILVCDWNECQYTTKSLGALNRHKRVHTLPFECFICKQRFSFKYSMKTHLTLGQKCRRNLSQKDSEIQLKIIK